MNDGLDWDDTIYFWGIIFRGKASDMEKLKKSLKGIIPEDIEVKYQKASPTYLTIE